MYLKDGDANPIVITVSIAKADVIFTPPVANISELITDEEAVTGEKPAETGDEPAYTAEVVFEE